MALNPLLSTLFLSEVPRVARQERSAANRRGNHRGGRGALQPGDAQRLLRPPGNGRHDPEEAFSARHHRPHYEVSGHLLPALASRTQGSQLGI